jgi:hypothetical protein
MNKPNSMTFKLDKETSSALLKILEHTYKTQLFVPEGISKLRSDLQYAIRDGCWIHGRLCPTFQVARNETHTVCPNCSPKEFTRLKHKYGGKNDKN